MKSAIAELRNRSVELQGVTNELRSEITESDYGSKRICVSSTNAHSGNDVPHEPLLVLKGKLNDVSVRVLKDDGCNTNVISQRLVNLNRQCFQLKRKKTVVRHSRDGWIEDSSHIVLHGTLKIGSHTYTSNRIVSDCRYDVLLGMPWHVANNPLIDYDQRIIRVGSDILPFQPLVKERSPKVRVSNLGVK